VIGYFCFGLANGNGCLVFGPSAGISANILEKKVVLVAKARKGVGSPG
jgi:hypothetical protein